MMGTGAYWVWASYINNGLFNNSYDRITYMQSEEHNIDPDLSNVHQALRYCLQTKLRRQNTEQNIDPNCRYMMYKGQISHLL